MSSIDVQCLGVFFLKTPANNHQWPFESQQSTFNVLKVLLCTFRACRQLLRIFFFFFFFILHTRIWTVRWCLHQMFLFFCLIGFLQKAQLPSDGFECGKVFLTFMFTVLTATPRGFSRTVASLYGQYVHVFTLFMHPHMAAALRATERGTRPGGLSPQLDSFCMLNVVKPLPHSSWSSPLWLAE